jgi:hypothetical protein
VVGPGKSGDFNGDGSADILLRHTSGILHTWLLNGTSIAAAARPGASGATDGRGVADFNGDGKADLLMRHTSGVFYIWPERHEHHGRRLAGGAGLDWTVEGLGDFNGDGKADILLRHTSGAFYIWLMNGTTIVGVGSPAGPA